jgi:hypothetical protein
VEDESSTVFADDQDVDPPLLVDELGSPDVVHVLVPVGAVVSTFVVEAHVDRSTTTPRRRSPASCAHVVG